jgi:ethanolamine ammonia-lyase small subunit
LQLDFVAFTTVQEHDEDEEQVGDLVVGEYKTIMEVSDSGAQSINVTQYMKQAVTGARMYEEMTGVTLNTRTLMTARAGFGGSAPIQG